MNMRLYFFFLLKSNGISSLEHMIFLHHIILSSVKRVEFLPIKAIEMHYFSNLCDKVLYIFRTCPLSIIRSISKLYIRSRYFSF